MTAAAWDGGFAADYDDWYPAGSADEAVRTLVDLAKGGPVLELGVGTGRIAVPLAARNPGAVWGIDASAPMLARLAAKDVSRSVTVVEGDMAALPLPGRAPRFALVFAAFNTFFLLASERDQRTCLARCRDVLGEGGRLALELYVPAPSAPGHRRWTDELTVGDRTVRREYERSATDPRLLVGRTDGRSWRLRPLPLDELDALARDAGFEPEYRWQSWRREPFLAARGTHVSVWTTSTGSGSPMPSPAPGSAG